MSLKIKRVYESPSVSDGKRILVDRLWPRGLSKEKAQIALWFKDIAPSTELRKWFDHDADKWEEFKVRYLRELEANRRTEDLREIIQKGDTTLLYGAKDQQHNHAIVLLEYFGNSLHSQV